MLYKNHAKLDFLFWHKLYPFPPPNVVLMLNLAETEVLFWHILSILLPHPMLYQFWILPKLMFSPDTCSSRAPSSN